MQHIKYLIIVFITVLVCQSSYGQEVPKTIVYGTVYNIFHDRYATDEAYFKTVSEDIGNIKEANFNLVMPFPFGQWDTETKNKSWERTDFLVEKLEQHDLMLMPIMLKSTHRAYLPTWKWLEISDAVREFPELSKTSEDVKYMHPEVLESIESYFKSIAERYGESTALVGYNLWNETHYESIDELSIPKFREWLKEKYETLPELNSVWAEDYSEWEQVTPLMSRNWESSMAAIDWDLFRFANNGDLAKWAYNTMRKYDKEHFNTINTVGTVINNPGTDQWTVDGRQIAPHTDVFGLSFYPDKYMNRHKKAMPYWQYSSIYNVTRSDAGDKPYYLVEAQTNQQNGMGLFQFMNYSDIHLLSWMAFADNCKGIVFWKWKPFYRGQQAFGRGLTMYNGELAPRGEAAKDVGAVLKKHGDLIFDATVRPAETAILCDIVALQKSHEAVTFPSSRGTTDFFMHESFEGTYKALFDNNISADVIRTDMPLNAEDLAQYKILYLPNQMVIRKEVAQMLKQYVKNGGWVVADARSGVMDEYDFGFEDSPGFGLDTLFGVRRLDLYAADSTFNILVSSNQIFSNKIPEDFSFEGIYYKEKLETLDGGTVIALFADDKSPAMIAKKSGKGMAILSAVSLGGSYYNGHDNIGNVLLDLALQSGVTQNAKFASEEHHGMMIKIHENVKGESLVYLINTSPQPFEGKINIPGFSKRPGRATEILEEKVIPFAMQKNELIFDLNIPAHRSKVIHIR